MVVAARIRPEWTAEVRSNVEVWERSVRDGEKARQRDTSVISVNELVKGNF